MRAYSEYDLRLHRETGKVTCYWQTNDDLDMGEPNIHADLAMEFKSLKRALEHSGGCRIGCSGVVVLVKLDGVLIDKEGNPVKDVEYWTNHLNRSDYSDACDVEEEDTFAFDGEPALEDSEDSHLPATYKGVFDA